VVSKTKLYSKLDLLETQLKESLVPHLINTANGNNDLVFCVKQFNPFAQLKNQTDAVMEELIEVGSQILSLREKLGEPSDGTIAERICWYCREWSKAKNYHSVSGIDLAKRFLLEIENQ